MNKKTLFMTGRLTVCQFYTRDCPGLQFFLLEKTCLVNFTTQTRVHAFSFEINLWFCPVVTILLD